MKKLQTKIMKDKNDDEYYSSKYVIYNQMYNPDGTKDGRPFETDRGNDKTLLKKKAEEINTKWNKSSYVKIAYIRKRKNN